jgi:hypothetical protein
MKLAAVALVLVFLGGCVPGDPAPGALTPGARAACEARGGLVQLAGLSAVEFCAEPQPDSGQSCVRSSDCRGYCVAQSRTCSTHDTPFGCYSYLDENGDAVEICVD